MRRKSILAFVIVALLGTRACFVTPAPPRISFPDGKRFAFSIIDDTDMTTLARARPVYETLERYGLRTTKTVWVKDSNDLSNPANQGDSLRNAEYRSFVLELQRKGFEIALHGIRGGDSRREEIAEGLDEFKRTLGRDPRMHINHSTNRDNLYWGRHVFSFAPLRWVGSVAMRREFSGHDPASPHFWGDIAKQRIQYVRRYTFQHINLLAVNPSFPYRLADKPDVNYWFPTANGDRVREFYELLKAENLDRLDREGGVCLVYAHLGSGSFNKGQGVDPRFESRLKDLVTRKGWFVPASEILDHLRRQPSWTGDLTMRERLRLDMTYLRGQLLPAFSN